jgi:hypothetical protein
VIKDKATFSDEHRAAAQKALDLLAVKVAAAPAEEHLMIARAVRTIFRKTVADIQRQYCAKAREGWTPERRAHAEAVESGKIKAQIPQT